MLSHALLLHALLLLLGASNSAGTAALVCLRGSYWSGNRCAPCPGGTFGNRPGLKSPQCSGPCTPGYFCPPGSTSSTQQVCGATTFYCPRGSASRQRVSDGYYTVAYPFPKHSSSTLDRAEKQTKCEPGFYCSNGMRRACPAGTYGLTDGLTMAACTGSCPMGSYCPEGTSTPLACPPGRYGGEQGLTTPSCTAICPIGHYCEQGSVAPRPCPPGVFGGQRGLTSKRCSSICSDPATCLPSLCPAGYYCPVATTSPRECGSIGFFCPEGSPAPMEVSMGYYTVWHRVQGTSDHQRLEDGYVPGSSMAKLNQTTRIDQQQCEPGTYCLSGVKRWCPAGTYGASTGLSTSACSGPCPAGYYCPTGTADFYLHPCTRRTEFCRVGSPTPTPVSTGYYTTTATTGDVRIDQVICPMGSYCVSGVKYLCPAGTYGSTTGLATALCSGRCQDGYTCPPGSISPTQTACPAGSYSTNGVACAPCLPGYYCSAGSPDPKQNVCGSDQVYCPLGSSTPTNVATGYYAVGQNPATHTSQSLCAVQTVQHIAQCPSRTIGVNSGL